MKKFAAILYYYLMGSAAAFALLATILFIPSAESSPWAPTFAFAFFQFFLVKILLKPQRPWLNGPKGRFLKKHHLGTCFVLFNLLIVATALYLAYTDFPDDPNDLTQFFALLVKLLLWIGAVVCLWALAINRMAIGMDRLFRKLRLFIRDYVSVYLLYRVFIFAITLGAGMLLLVLANRNTQDESSLWLLATYFQYVLEESLADNLATGFLSGESSFVSSLTAAASYFVLSDMALEFLHSSRRASTATRVRRMFLQKDTFKLLILTLLCIGFNFTRSSNYISLPYADELQIDTGSWILTTVLAVLWLISLIAFLFETKIVPYALNYVTMYFIECIIPMSTSFCLSIILLFVRILLFSVIAIIIAEFNHAMQQRIAYMKTGTLPPGASADAFLYQLTPVGTFALAVKTYGKLKRAPEMLLHKARKKFESRSHSH